MTLEELQRTLGLDGAPDALWLPLTDPTLAEMAAPEWRFAPKLVGFTGSSGTILVAKDRAALLTDSRYWVQAEGELLPGVELLRAQPASDAPWVGWLRDVLLDGGLLAADERLVSAAEADKMRARLAEMGLVFETRALPRLPGFEPLTPDVRVLPDPARSVAERVRAVREALPEGDRRVFVTASPDVCAWMTNLRNAARPASPVFPAVLALLDEEVMLETDVPLSDDVRAYLAAEGVTVMPNLGAELRRASASGRPLAYDHAAVSEVLAKRLAALWAGPIVPSEPIFERAMSRKTPAELTLIEEAMRRDGVALTEFYALLDERLAKGDRLTECDAVRMLYEERAKQPGFLGESFGTISAFGANAAMPHYAPKPETAAVLRDGLLLIDSGGQYWCGTTDVTRMTPVGVLSDEDRRVCGEVTRAMLRLAAQRFPEGAKGASLDAAARLSLWSRLGEDYGHGTGHGVGFVLNVHEGPVSLSPLNREPLREGNVLSDEPGIYQEGVRGVRVENMLAAERDEEKLGMLRWRHLTCVPIDVRTLPASLGEETPLLNAYNAWVRDRLMPHLSERARAWIERAAAPLAC